MVSNTSVLRATSDQLAVSRRRALGILGAGVTAGLAGPALSAGGVTVSKVDPEGAVRPELLKAAFAAAEKHRFKSRNRIVIVDFKPHSSETRLHVVDLKTGAVTSMLSAHGRGSDPKHDGFATVFNNTNGSGASSLGAYRVVGKGYGEKHGPNLILDGLDVSNNAARERAIIIHSAWYADPGRVKEWGKMGRSNGCFVTSDADRDRLFSLLEPDSLLFAGV